MHSTYADSVGVKAFTGSLERAESMIVLVIHYGEVEAAPYNPSVEVRKISRLNSMEPDSQRELRKEIEISAHTGKSYILLFRARQRSPAENIKLIPRWVRELAEAVIVTGYEHKFSWFAIGGPVD